MSIQTTVRSRGVSTYRVALAMVRSCGIAPAGEEDVAADVVKAMNFGPRKYRQALAVREIKRYLAKSLSVPERTMPSNLLSLKALGTYENARGKYRLWQQYDSGALGQFDYHSRRFAIENNLCPRCATPGEFGEDEGRCDCGFEYF